MPCYYTEEQGKNMDLNGFACVVYSVCLSREYYAINTMQDGFQKLKTKILENGGMME